MQQIRRTIWMLGAAMVLATSSAFAQGGEPAPALLDWKQLVLMALNGVGVFALVQVIKGLAPQLPAVAKQVLALAAGPA